MNISDIKNMAVIGAGNMGHHGNGSLPGNRRYPQPAQPEGG
jgi:hypothetical protein